MKLKQMKWAETHDWFVRSRRTPYGTFIVSVACKQVDANGNWSIDSQEFADFAELRAWAGY